MTSASAAMAPRASVMSTSSARDPRAKTTRSTARRSAPARRGMAPARAAGDDDGAGNPEPKDWRYAYLFDGACPVCQTLKRALEGTRKGKVWFVDISDPGYDPKRHQNVTFEEAMETIHVLKREGGEPLRGLQALSLIHI